MIFPAFPKISVTGCISGCGFILGSVSHPIRDSVGLLARCITSESWVFHKAVHGYGKDDKIRYVESSFLKVLRNNDLQYYFELLRSKFCKHAAQLCLLDFPSE
jgi:hypothetical protein